MRRAIILKGFQEQSIKPEPWIVFFDGYCHICSTAVWFITAVGDPQKIKVSSLQGETAKRFIGEAVLPDSLVVLGDGQIVTESAAVLAIGSRLGGIWSLAVRLIQYLPQPWLDSLYRVIAGNRYRFFSKRASCRLPSPREREFFLP